MNVDVKVTGDLERVRLGPGDRLVFTAAAGANLSSAQAEIIKNALEDELGCSVLVLSGGSLSVVEPV